jgi:hypothetical protein
VRRLAPLLAVLACALLWTVAPAAAATPVTWCGTDRLGANRTPDVETGSQFRVHVTYAIPSDGQDRFGTVASQIATDIGAIDEWWRGQDSTRTPRFDLFAFPGCTTQFGRLDIGFARLPRPGSFYADLDLLALSADLNVFGPPAVKNIVYYDGPVLKADVCGTTGYLADNAGGPFGFAFVWLRASDCEVDVGSGRLTAEVAAHELIHNLGAVQRQAPHHCGDPQLEGHVCDSRSDLLFPYISSGATIANTVLDVGRDDYYGHSGSWWDVQDSPWLMHLPLFPLAVSVDGAGGSVSADAGAISCPPACSADLEHGTKVTVRPVGGFFKGWSGACSGPGSCVVTMDAAKSVTATFGTGQFALAVKVTGRGAVRSTPSGIACPKSCSHLFAASSTVHLAAKAAKGYRFTGWSGACRGTKGCAVKLDSAKSVRAGFRKRA